MLNREKVIYKGSTQYSTYTVVDMTYQDRKAHVLFSGDRSAAFSGIPLDGKPELLFDYNQRMYELTVFTKPRRALILGGGTYTLPTALTEALPNLQLDVVEIDNGLDKIAQDYFDFKPAGNLRVIHSDGATYLQQCKKIYDLILIDAFSQLELPISLASPETAARAYRLLSPNGICAMNIISSYYGRSADTIRLQRQHYEDTYPTVKVFPADSSISLWQSQNFLLLAQKGRAREQYGMRFEPVDDL